MSYIGMGNLTTHKPQMQNLNNMIQLILLVSLKHA